MYNRGVLYHKIASIVPGMYITDQYILYQWLYGVNRKVNGRDIQFRSRKPKYQPSGWHRNIIDEYHFTVLWK